MVARRARTSKTPDMKIIDLNADLGEGGENDAAILSCVTSANIACGAHAGSPEILRRTIDLAIAADVFVGAHPGYEDRENFGRRELDLPLGKVMDLVAWQVEAFASVAGDHFHHVKPHGALYHQSNRSLSLAAAVIEGVRKVTPSVVIYAPPSGALAESARAAGMAVHLEGFADRNYLPDGSLMPRSEIGAVISEVDEAVMQAVELAGSGRFQTLCVHGDGAQAVAMLRAIRQALAEAGFGFRLVRSKAGGKYSDPCDP